MKSSDKQVSFLAQANIPDSHKIYQVAIRKKMKSALYVIRCVWSWFFFLTKLNVQRKNIRIILNLNRKEYIV